MMTACDRGRLAAGLVEEHIQPRRHPDGRATCDKITDEIEQLLSGRLLYSSVESSPAQSAWPNGKSGRHRIFDLGGM